MHFKRWLRTPQPEVTLCAVIIDIPCAEAVHLVLRRDHEPAGATPDHPGEGELILLGSGSTRPTEKGLDTLEFVDRDHRCMLARIRLASEDKDTSIERVGEDPVD